MDTDMFFSLFRERESRKEIKRDREKESDADIKLNC
jgi:hypothetical protein